MVKVGIVGTGHLGKIHIEQWKKIEEAELIGFYDIDKDVCAEVHQKYDIPAFPSLEALLEEIEALDIVTPTSTHFVIAKKAVRNGKHVFIEKPVTATLEEAEKLRKFIREANVVAQVGFVERFNPAFLTLQKMHLTPKFIEVHRLAQWNPRGTDVSVVLDLMIHDIDIVLKLVNSTVNKVYANGVAVVSANPDIANARVEFHNGAVANFTASRISFKNMRKMRLFQPYSYISIDFLNKKSEICRVKEKNTNENGQITSKEFLDLPHAILEIEGTSKVLTIQTLKSKPVNAIELELRSFLQAIISQTSPPVTIYDAYNSLALATEIMNKIMQRQF